MSKGDHGRPDPIKAIFSGIAEVVKQADSTTKALAAIPLAVLVFLTVLAANEVEGFLKLIVIGAAFFVVIFTLAILGFLERLRIVQGSKVSATGISIRKKKSEVVYDAFISAPMDSSLDNRGAVKGRSQIMQIRQHLKDVCGFQSIFYAASERTSKNEFDTTAVALSDNFQTLLKSSVHIFIYPERKPASTLVEVGMALALGMPSVWFIKEGTVLPFLLRQAWQNSSSVSELPRITVYRYSEVDDILRIISERRDGLF